jgi:hypothetical protein
MWRTGSSYLLSRFSADERYFSVYEPYNGELSSARQRHRAAQSYAHKREALRHPAVDGGYFGMFNAADPADGRPLWRLSHPRLALHDVYNQALSAQGLALLNACERVARSRQQRAVFGFCHSGLQIDAMAAAMGGEHLYLYREPREQFHSYGPHTNDFFVAATVMQLMASAPLRATACRISPWLRSHGAALAQPFTRHAPHWLAMRWGRRLWRRMPMAEQYAQFYLSWLASNAAAARGCSLRFSLADLQADSTLRDTLAARYGIGFAGLNHRPTATNTLGLDFAPIEAHVTRLWRSASNAAA